MKITFQADPEDPVYPIMHGRSPAAKEFNKRMKKFWKDGVFDKTNFTEFITTSLMEMLIDDYNLRHKKK